MLRRRVPFIISEPPHITIMSTVRQKSSGGRRPKKKTYHRVPELDRVMELRKKPSMILELKTLIQSQPKNNPLFLRDLEKNVGFVRKWDFNSSRSTQPFSAIPLETVEFVGPELGLPCDFKECLIEKYPQFFSVRRFNGRDFVYLEDWDSTLAVTAREARLAHEGIVNMKPNDNKKKVKISRDGNYAGPFAFKVNFPAGFRPNVNFLEQFERWQKLEFPSPYLNARRFDAADPKTRKRTVAVIHELLSLTLERRLTSAQLDAFHAECFLPSQLLLCLIKHHGIFYLTNKGVRSTVFLKDAYVGSNLVDKCPLLQFNDKFVALCGRGNVDLCDSKSSLQAAV
ncbi:hypothetical protein P8452_69717 [Trifolium repens]|nr:hypothetical protein P8452_69717 [Trifolium repens]